MHRSLRGFIFAVPHLNPLPAAGERRPDIVLVALLFSLFAALSTAAQDQGDPPLDWGSNHVGKPMPMYEDGNTCLFCHRNEVGNSWQENPHQTTIRLAEETPALDALRSKKDLAALADETRYIMGHAVRQRYLKSGEGYGKMDVLSVQYEPEEGGEGKLIETANPHWDNEIFGASCAGCHASGVDSTLRSFFATSNDCFTCHGVVPSKHTERPALALLAPSGRDDARVVASICGSCHLRGGESRSTSLPYPNNYVPGDNLFFDFDVDFSDENLAKMNAADRHIFANVRDIVLNAQRDVTCVTCHDVHGNSTEKHESVVEAQLCYTCHVRDGDILSTMYDIERHSAVCGY